MFTVVIPLYNKREFISSTLEAVLSQSGPEFEVVVVDDGSTDGGAETVAAVQDPRVRLVRQANKGVAVARNRGVDEARFPWIAFLDGDDLWRCDHLHCLSLAIAATPKAGFVSTRWQFVSGKEGSALLKSGQVGQVERVSYFRNSVFERRYFHTSGIAVRRDVFLSVGGFGPYRRGQDVELWVRLAIATPCAIIRATTDFRRADPEGITARDESRPRQQHVSRKAMPTPVLRTLAEMLDTAPDLAGRRDIELYHDFRLAVGVVEEFRKRNLVRAIRLSFAMRRPFSLLLVLSRRSDR
jgi:hypothetical protein